MQYRCVATSLEGFIQQLAVQYVARGYRFYVTGVVPERLQPEELDRNMLVKFDLDISRQTRSRRKRKGIAGVQYLRHGNFWVLIATYGRHRFFREHGAKWDSHGRLAESSQLLDVNEVAVKYGGYSVRCRNRRVRVAIEREAYRELKAYFLDIAVKRSVESLRREFWFAPFEPYWAIKDRMFVILRAVNKKRKTAGLRPVDESCVRLRRRQIPVFDPVDWEMYRIPLPLAREAVCGGQRQGAIEVDGKVVGSDAANSVDVVEEAA